MTETRIYSPKGSIYFQSYTGSELVNKLTETLITNFSRGL